MIIKKNAGNGGYCSLQVYFTPAFSLSGDKDRFS